MKYTRTELINSLSGNIQIDKDVDIDSSVFETLSGINAVKDVHVSGTGYFEADDETLYLNLNLEGLMLCPDSITGEEIEHPFETDVEDAFSFGKSTDENVREVDGEIIDIIPALIDAIIMEVPLSVTHADPDDYPSGDGWRVITEEEYQASLANRTDPRLAKLKEFKND